MGKTVLQNLERIGADDKNGTQPNVDDAINSVRGRSLHNHNLSVRERSFSLKSCCINELCFCAALHVFSLSFTHEKKEKALRNCAFNPAAAPRTRLRNWRSLLAGISFPPSTGSTRSAHAMREIAERVMETFVCSPHSSSFSGPWKMHG